MTSVGASFHDRNDAWRRGSCPERLGDKWCVYDEGHPPLYHVTDNGVAWATDEAGVIFDVHALTEAGRFNLIRQLTGGLITPDTDAPASR